VSRALTNRAALLPLIVILFGVFPALSQTQSDAEKAVALLSKALECPPYITEQTSFFHGDIGAVSRTTRSHTYVGNSREFAVDTTFIMRVHYVVQNTVEIMEARGSLVAGLSRLNETRSEGLNLVLTCSDDQGACLKYKQQWRWTTPAEGIDRNGENIPVEQMETSYRFNLCNDDAASDASFAVNFLRAQLLSGR
jgi:hypothetical protein